MVKMHRYSIRIDRLVTYISRLFIVLVSFVHRGDALLPIFVNACAAKMPENLKYLRYLVSLILKAFGRLFLWLFKNIMVATIRFTCTCFHFICIGVNRLFL